MGTMFIILPTFWMGAMGWAGISAGAALTNISSTGSRDVKGAGGKVGDKLGNKVV